MDGNDSDCGFLVDEPASAAVETQEVHHYKCSIPLLGSCSTTILVLHILDSLSIDSEFEDLILPTKDVSEIESDVELHAEKFEFSIRKENQRTALHLAVENTLEGPNKRTRALSPSSP